MRKSSTETRRSSALTRFLALFTVQTAVLLVVVVLCYRGLGRLRERLEGLAGTLPKATAVAEVLHYSDVLRVIHVTLIGAARNPDYVDERLNRLEEVEGLLEKSLTTMESVEWTPAERQVIEKVVVGMRGYAEAFPPVLSKARGASLQELPELIQANTALRRDAYNLLLEMLPKIRGSADETARVNASDFGRIRVYILGGLALTIALSAWTFSIFLVSNRQSRLQAGELNRSMQALSDGDLSTSCRVISHDELGRVAQNLNQIFQLLARNIRTIGQISGNLESVADVMESRSRAVMGSAATQGTALDEASFSLSELNAGIRKISLNVSALSASTEETSASTLELVSSMEEVSRNTDTLFASVEQTGAATRQMVASISDVNDNVDSLKAFVIETSSSMVEMTASIGEVERNAAHSYEVARTLRQSAESGINAVRETTEGMGAIRREVHEANDVMVRLGQRSTEIGRIINVIDDVASKTNLLALNAAILAAQAGDQGRGFSVVADEIRDLAERTAQSTKEIGTLIRSVQEEVSMVGEAMSSGARTVDRGVALADESARVFRHIVESAEKSLQMSQEIAAAMKEQAKSSEVVTRAVTRVQDMVKQINSATNQQATGSEHILDAVEQMRDVARSVRSATGEQKKGSLMISSAAEQMIEMVRQISGVTDGQAGESEKIVKTMEQVRLVAHGNRTSAVEMNESVTLLSNAIRELDEEVRKFKIRT